MALSFLEDHISQIPAIMLLEKLGYTYLSPSEALALRGGSTANVLLEPILSRQIAAINTLRVSSTKAAAFTPQNIANGIEALRNPPMAEGYLTASKAVYELLTGGKTLEQSIDGDKLSFTLRYIDWQHPENNVYHVTEEFAVSRAGTADTHIPAAPSAFAGAVLFNGQSAWKDAGVPRAPYMGYDTAIAVGFTYTAGEGSCPGQRTYTLEVVVTN